MRVREGQKYRSNVNGREFQVRLAGERMVVLGIPGRKEEFVTTIDKLQWVYEKVGEGSSSL